MVHTRQSRPDSGLSFFVKVLKTFQVVPSALGSGRGQGTRHHDTTKPTTHLLHTTFVPHSLDTSRPDPTEPPSPPAPRRPAGLGFEVWGRVFSF